MTDAKCFHCGKKHRWGRDKCRAVYGRGFDAGMAYKERLMLEDYNRMAKHAHLPEWKKVKEHNLRSISKYGTIEFDPQRGILILRFDDGEVQAAPQRSRAGERWFMHEYMHRGYGYRHLEKA